MTFFDDRTYVAVWSLFAGAIEKDAAGSAMARASHLAPALAIPFVTGLAFAVGIKHQMIFRSDVCDGQDVPGGLGNDVGDDEVNFLGGIARVAGHVFDAVTGIGEALSRLDLDAPESVSGVEDEVVALAVAPGLGGAEAEAGDAGEERGFDGFANFLGGGETDGVNFGNESFRKSLRK
jgi:hypothetical protein